jgi:hypothetical protein
MPSYVPDPEFWLANWVIEKMGFGEIIDYEPPIACRKRCGLQNDGNERRSDR